MPVLVYVEERAGAAVGDSLAALDLARALDPDVRAVVVGADVGATADAAARHGASLVYVADHPELVDPRHEPRARIVERLIREQQVDTLLLAASVLTADMAGWLAAALETGVNWDLVELRAEGPELVGTRLVFGDAAGVDVRWLGTPRIGLIRPGTGSPVETGTEGELVGLDIDPLDLADETVLVGSEALADDGQSLEDAQIVVAGGKGLGAGEKFALLEDLAAELGGVVGASRAAVELGWYPQAAQIGQTGRSVSPRLYIACGISGAIHHKVGMHRSEVVVAINTDRGAPIFDFCDFGVVGDATAFVPRLADLLRERAGA
jgi:electron transfer flavoprotein alpha subunit